MKLSCLLGHRWNNGGRGCRCEKCGLIRGTGHDWNGCKCRVCGTTRDEGHDFSFRPDSERTADGAWKQICRGQCGICGRVITWEHVYDPAGEKCCYQCQRCGVRIVRHAFRPVPGRCAEVCSVCGEERDYRKIALDETKAAVERAEAVERLKRASMMPEELEKECANGKHIWIVSKINRQRFQGGASSTEYTCAVCGKKDVEIDWGN